MLLFSTCCCSVRAAVQYGSAVQYVLLFSTCGCTVRAAVQHALLLPYGAAVQYVLLSARVAAPLAGNINLEGYVVGPCLLRIHGVFIHS